MNLKKAKKLRALVRQLSNGTAKQDLDTRTYLRHNRTGNIINDPQSARGFYQQLKKQEGKHVPHISGD